MVTNLSKPAESIRAFIAIELPPEVKSALAMFQQHLAGHASVLKFVAPNSIHLTLRFLGSVSPARLPVVEQATRAGARAVSSFVFSLDRIGAFPVGSLSPRVVWIGMKRDAGFDSLQHLYRSVEDELTRREFPPDQRALSPHLTLARVREQTSLPELRRLAETIAVVRVEVAPCGSFEVRSLAVMRSDLGPTGPRYTALAHAPLGGSE